MKTIKNIIETGAPSNETKQKLIDLINNDFLNLLDCHGGAFVDHLESVLVQIEHNLHRAIERKKSFLLLDGSLKFIIDRKAIPQIWFPFKRGDHIGSIVIKSIEDGSYDEPLLFDYSEDIPPKYSKIYVSLKKE